MLDISQLLKVLVIILFAIRILYWRITETRADKEKPKTTSLSTQNMIKKLVTAGVTMFVLLQLSGLEVLIYEENIPLQLIGFILVSIGLYICIVARRELGANWAHAAEYQVKKEHELVTTGIYAYIRHPIYTGIFCMYVGAEMVANSYMVVLFLICMIPVAYIQAKNEEKLLREHFGEEHSGYMKRSKMFIPYIL